MRRIVVLAGCLAAVLAGPLATRAAAQPPPGPPGVPAVITNADCSITLTFTPGPNATHHLVLASYNGVPLGPFNIGTLVTIRSAPIPAGNYSLTVIAVNAGGQTQGGPNNFMHSCGGVPPPGGPPGVPTWVSAGATGNTVTLSWTNAPGATATDIEAIMQATGQVISLQVGPQSTFSVPGVPAGNFHVRIRNRNAFGVSAFTESRLVVVGPVLGVGDLQVTLTWNTRTDIDLHVIEPDGTHVYYAARNGRTARLDFDNTIAFGPENIFVAPGAAAPGIYQVYIVHYSGNTPTTSAISVVLNPGTPNARVALLTRPTSVSNPNVGYNVANVDVRNSTIVETTGTRDERPADVRPKRLTEAAAGSR